MEDSEDYYMVFPLFLHELDIDDKYLYSFKVNKPIDRDIRNQIRKMIEDYLNDIPF